MTPLKYRYDTVTNTGTSAGNVSTDAFLYVDKETGLPLHSETLAQSQAGANVQGYNGVRIITEISDIQPDTTSELFEIPTDLKEIDPAQVRQQVDMIFSGLASFVAQMMKNAPSVNANTMNSNAMAPAR